MLQIYLYGPMENGWLDINPDTSLSMEGLTEIFDEDLSTGEFSLPVEIPWTAANRRKFGFAERLENFSKATKFFKCDVYDRGFPELVSAKLTILERTGSFSYTKGSFSASISGSRGLFGSLIRGKKMKDLALGGTIAWATDDSRTFAYKCMTGLYPQYSHIKFAPVANENFIDATRPDYAGEFLAKDCVNNVIVNGSAWTFGRPLSTNPTLAAASGDAEYMDYRTVPFFQLKYVLRKCFEEFGYNVTGALLDSQDFDDLFLYNNRAIEDYAPTTRVDFNRTITPANHMANIPIADFIKAWFSYLNIYPVFTGASDVRLHYRATVLKAKTILPLNDVSTDTFTSTYQDIDNETGYKLAFTPDDYFSDRVKDLIDKKLVATVARRSDLDALNVGYQLTTNHIALVKADNLYYQVADATTTPIKWDAYAEALHDFVKGTGARENTVALSPLCTYVQLNPTTALFERKDYVGCRHPGAYKNNKGEIVKNDFPIAAFYLQMRTIGAVTKPATFNNNRDANNSKILPYALSWNGIDGIAENFHTAWQAVLENGEVVKTAIDFNQRVRTDLANNNTAEIKGILYLVQKMERTVPARGVCTLYLMPL